MPSSFLRAEGELEQDVHTGPGVVRQLLLLLPVFDQRVAAQADALVPLDALLDPVLVPELPAPIGLRVEGCGLRVGQARDRAGHFLHHLVGADEELQFHLLELARAEGEVARVDLVAERLADLANAKRHPLARDIQHVLELDEDGLRRFGAQVGRCFRAFDRARRRS